MPKLSAKRVGVCVLLSVLGLSASAQAQGEASWGGVRVTSTVARAYDLPLNLAPDAMIVRQSTSGVTLMFTTTGSGRNLGCAVIVATQKAATRFDYRYNDTPTRCDNVIPHPDGGFFLRATNPAAVMGENPGLTAYIDLDGVEQWVILDSTLIDARSQDEGGSGAFVGVYDGPNTTMAYDPQRDRFMGFTNAALIVGVDARPLSQAYIVDVATGKILRSGRTFGGSPSGQIQRAIVRPGAGDFLIQVAEGADRGAAFFSYDGRIRVTKIEPLEEDWSQRVIEDLNSGLTPRTHLLWTPGPTAETPTFVSVLNDQGNAIWSREFPQEMPTLDGMLDLGRPRSVAAGTNMMVVTHSVNGQRVYHVLDAQTGDSLGLLRAQDIADATPLKMLGRIDGSVRLLVANTQSRRLEELQLTFEDADVVAPEPPMESPDMGPPTLPPILDPEEGCCAQVPVTPSRTPLVFLAVLCVGIFRRAFWSR